jgi:hypothetical protein
MRAFISSVMASYRPFRDAAVQAARELGHEVRRAEDFGASADSPQQRCLAGVRWAEVVVLILGARYGVAQASGMSATHEEYHEARDRCPVLAFVQEGVEPELEQQRFLTEVRAWTTGHYTASFSTPEELRAAVTRALHDLALSTAAGPVDEAEMLRRAIALVPEERRGSEATLALVVAGGPRQPVLRPAQLEDPALRRDLTQAALFGDPPVFDPGSGTTPRMEGDALLLEQERASLLVDPLGTVRLMQAAEAPRDRRGFARGFSMLIEEDVRELLVRGLRFVAVILDCIDPPRRLSDVVPVVTVDRGSTMNWRTRAEHANSPTVGTVAMGAKDRVVVQLAPARRHRAALSQAVAAIAEDFTVLLRREIRDKVW